MAYLSKEIEALAKRKNQITNSLVRTESSCGIFQDYGDEMPLRLEGNQNADC